MFVTKELFKSLKQHLCAFKVSSDRPIPVLEAFKTNMLKTLNIKNIQNQIDTFRCLFEIESSVPNKAIYPKQ